MFGFQRVADLIYAFGDARGRGFLLGATAGRTTLNGEGLQHQDGHSHLVANVYPNMLAYDPAYAYEVAVLIREGLRRMLEENEDLFYYITLYNENYLQPPMPEGVEEGIIRGIYRVAPAPAGKHRAHLFGSGPILNCARVAQEILAEHYDVAADVWNVTSYQQLFRDGRTAERWNRLHPGDTPRQPYLAAALAGAEGPVVAVSDWVEELPSLVARFLPNRFVPLGANGFGRSDTRHHLRGHFEINPAAMVLAVLHGLMLDREIDASLVQRAIRDLKVNPEARDPMCA
jgi:pyruvate dehydrogenase E1 component